MKTVEQIAADVAGYDAESMTADAVTAFLTQLVQPVHGAEEVAIFQALGRVLAEDVISPVNVPPHDNSAMDGFAFASAALAAGGVLSLKVVGTAFAGAPCAAHAQAGECIRVMTGAVMPKGLDTVVPQEVVAIDADTVRFAASAVAPGANRRATGEDVMKGSAALSKGERIGPAALGLLASLGIATVSVVRRVRVAYFSTGDEILSLGDAPRDGAVYDSNRYTVCGLLTRLGCDVVDLGAVRDDPVLLEATYRRAADSADAIITSGGMSGGDADHTRALMPKLGDVAFWQVAVRPGRPMAVGRVVATLDNAPARSALLFGLPGNPVAVMVCFLAFVRPALLQMMGARDTQPVLLRARTTTPIQKKPGRTEYQRAVVKTTAQGELEVTVTGHQGSGVLSSMVRANGLIVLQHGQPSVSAGDLVDVMMFEGVV